MRQLIIGADVEGPFTSAVEGSLSIQYIQSSGIPALVGTSIAADLKSVDGQFRFIRRGGSDAVAEVASPWFRPSDFKSWTSKMYNAGTAQVIKRNFTGFAAADESSTAKLVFTTSGYEPFERYTFSFLGGANVDAMATNLVAEIQAKIDAGGAPKISSVAVDSDTSQVNITLIDGERAEFVYDAEGSNGAVELVAGTAFVFPVGTYDKLVAEEVDQQGREWSNYDRYTALPDENKTYAVSGETYNEHTFRFVNSAEGQIRGVDNMREIKIAIPYEIKGATGNAYNDGSSTGEISGETFENIIVALTGHDPLYANGD